MKLKIEARDCFGIATGVLIGLFTGLILPRGEAVVGAASAASQAENPQMNPELKMDLLIDTSGDKVVSRILNLERGLNSLTTQVAAYENISARAKDLQVLSLRQVQAEAKWRRETEKLKRRLSVNEDAIKKLCARASQAGRIRRPGIPKTIAGSACDDYKPAR